MRTSLADLISKSIIFHYDLPAKHYDGSEIPKVSISTESDRCLEQTGSDQDVSSIIYNGIVEYAYDDSQIDLTKLDSLQIRALISKLKFNTYADESKQLGYGFYGEVLLHLIPEHFYGAKKCIARGYFYSPLENSETKGYDSYLIIEDKDNIDLYFGEAKFYIDGYKKSVSSIFESIDKALSDTYLKKNFYAFENHYEHIADGSVVKQIMDEWTDNPSIDLINYIKKYNIKLVYPMLIIFHNENKKEYDDRIKAVVEHINNLNTSVEVTLSIPVSYFFIFLPVNDSREIKKAVLEWIEKKQSVTP